MKVTVEDRSSVKKVLHIEIPEETVAMELDEAYRNLKKTAKVKGFRPGKTPRSVLEGLYKKDIHADVASKLIQGAFVDALKETDIKIVGTPKVDPPELKDKGIFQFDAEVEVNPEIGPIAYKALQLKKTLYAASEEEIELQLKMLQKNLAKVDKIAEDRPVETGDLVLIDYEGFKAGVPFPETPKTENYILKVGNATLTGQFDDGLTGMKAGEDKDIPVSFPQDYLNKELAGQEVTFHVRMHEIRQETLPPVDDELAKQLGPFNSLDELKSKIRENLTRGYEKRMEQELNEQIFQQLLSKITFEVPDSLVEMELNHIIQDTQRSFQYANKSMEELGLSPEGLSREYRETAIQQVRRHIILNQIIEQEKLEVASEELDQAINEMAAAYKQPAEEIKRYYHQNQQGLELFKHTLLEKKAIKIIMDSSQIEEVAPEKQAAAAESSEGQPLAP
jgi:trigger factor